MNKMEEMNATSHLTDIEDQSQDETGKNYWAVILLVLCVFVVFGNVLVILSVARERLLQNMTNFFIVSLAMADLLVAGFVMPLSVYVLVNWGMWGLPKVVCDFYIASDVICSTSSIFNLVAVSIDRYYAVTAPITYSQHKDKHGRVYAFIVLCWLASIAIGSPIMLGANHIPEEETSPLANQSQFSISNETSQMLGWNMTDHDTTNWNITDHRATSWNRSNVEEETHEFVCAFYNPDFIIYSSLGSFYIPCMVMIFLYGRIFKTLHQRAVKARKAKKKQLVPTKPQVKEPIALAQVPGSKPVLSGKALTVSATNGGATTTFLSETPFKEEVNQTGCKGQRIEIRIDVPLLENCGTSCMSSSPSQLPSSFESSEPNGANSPPPKPNMAHKACGPDTSLYDRVKSSSASPRNGKEKVNGIESKSCSISKAPLRDTNPGAASNCVQLHPASRGKCDGEITPVTMTLSIPDLSEEVEKKFQFREFSENLFKLRQRVSRKVKTKKKKEKNAARKERKATKTLAIVLGCFLVCWTPFFTCNMINAICIKLESSWHPGDTAFLITTWLGYVNSCINPIIYTIFNPEFRKAFKKILGMGH